MYQADPQSGDIVINGFGNGIGDSPYTGIVDERNVNIISVPGEASVNFKTENIASGAIAGNLTNGSGTTATLTATTGAIEDYVAIYFTSVASYSGATVATPYWTKNISGSTYTLYQDYARTTPVSLSGSGTATWKAYQVGVVPSYVSGGTFVAGGIQYFSQNRNIPINGAYFTFGVDGAGQVWGNQHTTGTNNFWTYTGNSITDNSNVLNASGNGLVYYRFSNGGTGASLSVVDYLFVFRRAQIDYMVVQVATGSGPTTQVWTNGWKPSDGSTGNNNYLNSTFSTVSHDSKIGFDGRAYYCDGDNIGKFFQTAPTTIFNPTDTTTYTYLTFNLLPVDDVAQCIEPFGTNMLIGGQGYWAYQWNTTSNLVSNYIPIAEAFVSKIVTVNVNAYIFAGNRGRIYITNGSQANLWKKVPDHITNTVEPRFQWQGATATKNQLYFSFSATSNSDTTPLTSVGGLWAVDLDTKAFRLTNILSYGSYAGFASAIIPKTYNPLVGTNSPAGPGLFIGWNDGGGTINGTCGIDQPAISGQTYTGGQAYVISDMIPIGTKLKPTTPAQVEFKLSSPLLTGESVELQIASSLSTGTNPTFTSAVIVQGDGSLVSGNSEGLPLNKMQWIMVKAILTSIASNPSFNRLTELRIIQK